MSADPSAVAIAITGLGLRTPVGANALQTATSALAGLNRFREWPHLGLEPSPGEAGLPSASAIPGLGDAPWQDKAFELARPALEEALFSASLFRMRDLDQAYGRRAFALYMAAPYSRSEQADHGDALGAIEDVLEACLEGFEEVPSVVDAVGHASVIRCLAAATRDLHEQRIDVAIVGGVDSLLDTAGLVEMIGENRIKLEQTAGGVIPGEGAGFLVVERRADLEKRRVEAMGLLGTIALADESIRYDGTDPLTAAGLTDALYGILDHCDPAEIGLADVYVDLNGERGRFQEWALAEGRCLHQLPYGWRLHCPALSLGDLGAVSGVAMAAIATQTFRLGRARGSAALLCSTSERGERAAALVGAPSLVER